MADQKVMKEILATMSRQDEIRGEVFRHLNDVFCDGVTFNVDDFWKATDNLLQYLHSQGVVVKVGEISEDVAQTASDSVKYFAQGGGIAMMLTPKSVDVFKAFKDAGFVAVEPLILKEQQ